VVAVDHPGNSLGAYTPAGFGLWWLRCRDISLAITTVLADPRFSAVADRARIGAAGFSLGGYTVLELAGARTDRSASVWDNAVPLARQIPDARLLLLSRGVGHYTFLDQCTEKGRRLQPTLCRTPAIVQERAHRDVVDAAANFFSEEL
jgi:predicted dienelactone hydrolase